MPGEDRGYGHVRRAASRDGIAPVWQIAFTLTVRQRCRGEHDAVRGLQNDLGKRFHWIEPATVDTDIEFARIGPVYREPVDKIGVHRPAKPVQHRLPRGKQVDPPG